MHSDPKQTLPSIDTNGGPVLAIPAEQLKDWRGTLAPKGVRAPPGWAWGDRGGPACDYDRACGKREQVVQLGAVDSLATIPVGRARALVLESATTTTFARLDEGGVLVRGTTIRIEQAREAIALAKKWKKTPHLWTLPSGRFHLLDSAMSGSKAKTVRCVMLPGTYAIEGAEVPFLGTFISLWRLVAPKPRLKRA